MPLPKINEFPTFFVTLPSSGKEISYRPFTVKEQKILMIANESTDNKEKEIVRAITDTVESCVQDNVDIDDLPVIDLEYLFLQIRTRSVGEVSEYQAKCKKCDKMTPVSTNLIDLNVDMSAMKENTIKTDDHKITLRIPSNSHIAQMATMNLTTETEIIDYMVRGCLDTLRTEEGVIYFKDEDPDDILDFVNHFTPEQYQTLVEYISNVPSLRHEQKFTCESCGEENILEIEGLFNFFQ